MMAVGNITVKCKDCKLNYVSFTEQHCRECIERQIKEEE